jgi:hypothetical protein
VTYFRPPRPEPEFGTDGAEERLLRRRPRSMASANRLLGAERIPGEMLVIRASKRTVQTDMRAARKGSRPTQVADEAKRSSSCEPTAAYCACASALCVFGSPRAVPRSLAPRSGRKESAARVAEECDDSEERTLCRSKR